MTRLAVVWAQEAFEDVDSISQYISRSNPHAADRLSDLIFSVAERLGENVYMYRSGRRPGTREVVVHPNYVLVYRVEAALIRVVNVMHTSRQYP